MILISSQVYPTAILRNVINWLDIFFHNPPLQIQMLSIPSLQKSHKSAKFHTTYCEETIDDYEPPNRLYNVSHCS